MRELIAFVLFYKDMIEDDKYFDLDTSDVKDWCKEWKRVYIKSLKDDTFTEGIKYQAKGYLSQADEFIEVYNEI